MCVRMCVRRFAAILTSKKVETTVRLWSVLQADPTFLQTHLEISDETAELIKKTVRGMPHVCVHSVLSRFDSPFQMEIYLLLLCC